MKLIRILGIISAIALIVLGILYFMDIQFPNYLLPLSLSFLIICGALQTKKK